MHSSPTPSSPTRLCSPEPHASWRWLVLCAALLAGQARAHGEVDDPLPAETGLSWEAAAVLRTLQANKPLPSAHLDGVLLQGDAGMDPDGTQLEHGTLGLAARWNDTWGARLVIGKHRSEAAEAEEAWVQARHDADNGDVWRLAAGRQRPAMGAVLAGAGHFDSFGLMPLSTRMATDHHWVDDGLQLAWRREATANWAVDLGLWRGQGFPGSAKGASAPSLHLGWGQGPWQADALWAGFRPQGRGATVSTTAGHSHGAPVCDASFTEVICFSGDTTLVGGSLRWSGPAAQNPWPFTLTAAGWLRRDNGALESANGLADLASDHRAGWLEALWHARPDWTLGWRGERLSATHRLHGAGASLLVTEARLQLYQPSRRQALTLGWQVRPWARLHLETGQENVAGTRARYTALRLLLSGSGTWSSNP